MFNNIGARGGITFNLLKCKRIFNIKGSSLSWRRGARVYGKACQE